MRGTRSTSAVQAVPFVGGTAAVAAAVGGGAALLGMFSLPFMVGLAAMTAAAYPVSFVLLEVIRLGRSHRLLREVLDSERTYESLLADARQERDNLQAEVQRLRVGEDAARALQGFVNSLGAPPALPAPKRKRKEPNDG